MFQTEVVDEFKTHILCSTTFFKYRAIYEIMRKNTVQPGEKLDINAHAHCMLDT